MTTVLQTVITGTTSCTQLVVRTGFEEKLDRLYIWIYIQQYYCKDLIAIILNRIRHYPMEPLYHLPQCYHLQELLYKMGKFKVALKCLKLVKQFKMKVMSTNYYRKQKK
eukprot:345233_1